MQLDPYAAHKVIGAFVLAAVLLALLALDVI